MNNTIQTNQSYQKFNEILTARHIINRWLSTGSVSLRQLVSHCISIWSPDDCYLLINKIGTPIQYLTDAD